MDKLSMHRMNTAIHFYPNSTTLFHWKPLPYSLIICSHLHYFRSSWVIKSEGTTSKQRLTRGFRVGSCLVQHVYCRLTQLPSKKFAFADDLALAYRHTNLNTFDLTADLTTLEKYLNQWRLKPNLIKTITSCFHPSNNMAKIQLNIY